MVFANPWLLWGLIALCIPIIIHLVRLRRLKTIAFSSFKFLKKTAEKGARPKQWHKLLIMAMRLVGLLMLVLGFAMPACNKAQLQKNKLLVGVVLDNTISMAGKLDGSLDFDARKEWVKKYIAALPSYAELKLISSSSFGGVSNGINKEDAIKWVNEQNVNSSGDKISKLLSRLLVSMQKESGVAKQIAVFSDFQASEVLPGRLLNKEEIPVKCVDFGIINEDNLGIDSVWLENSMLLQGEKAKIYFSIKNYGKNDNSSIAIKLYNNGVQLALASIKCKAQDKSVGIFEIDLPAERENMWIELDDNGFDYDNKKYIYVAPMPKIGVNTLGQNNMYINEVLAAQDIFEQSNEAQTSICTNCSPIELQKIVNKVENGGTALISFSTAADYIKQIVGVKNLEKQTCNVSIAASSLSNPFYKRVYKKMPENAEMPKVTNYFKSVSGLGYMLPIITLENGDVFFAQVNKGKGKLYICLAELNKDWSNWVNSSLFLPTITQSLLPNTVQGQLYGTLQANTPSILNTTIADTRNEYLIEKDTQKWQASLSQSPLGTQIYIGSEIEKPGVYSVINKGTNMPVDRIALNINEKESEVAQWNHSNFEKLMGTVEWQKTGDGLSADLARINIAPKSNTLWRLFIWAATIFFVAEMLLIWFNNRKTQQVA